MKLKKQLENILEQIEKLNDFAERLGDVPESQLFTFSLSPFRGSPTAIVSICDYALSKHETRDHVLSYVGDQLGRMGWEKTLSYDHNHYDWSKMFLGVKVSIFNAESINLPKTIPVMPTEFPITLPEHCVTSIKIAEDEDMI